MRTFQVLYQCLLSTFLILSLSLPSIFLVFSLYFSDNFVELSYYFQVPSLYFLVSFPLLSHYFYFTSQYIPITRGGPDQPYWIQFILNIFLKDSLQLGLFYQQLCHSFINQLTQSSFAEMYTKHPHSQSVRSRNRTFQENVHQPCGFFDTCHVSCVQCHMFPFF